MTHSSIHIDHADNEEVIVKRVLKDNWLFPFIPIGKASMRNKECKDALAIVCKFNKGELALLNEVRAIIEPNNEIKLIKRTMSTTQQRQFTTAINSWIKLEILKRIKREHYIVSPYFLTPPKANQLDVKTKWDSL